MNNYNRGELMRLLKRLAVIFGILVAIVSIYFSYDGLDQTVNGGNPTASDSAKYVGVFVALVITLLQFIFNTDFRNLNMTLKILGAASYVYSIYTNFEGIQHIFGYNVFISWFGAGLMDILPESFIAWGLNEHLQGDFLGNVVKLVMGDSGKGQNQNQPREKQFSAETPRETQPRVAIPQQYRHPQGQHQGKKGKGRSFLEQERDKEKGKFAGFGDDE